jgi:hypothetical protein
MTLKTPEMTGTKSKFRSKFRFQLYSVPATGRNISGILNLEKALMRDYRDIKDFFEAGPLDKPKKAKPKQDHIIDSSSTTKWSESS